MIVYVDLETKECQTNGCSCCSCKYDLDIEKKEILYNLKDQLETMIIVLSYYNITPTKFLKMIKNGEIINPYGND